MSSVGGVVRSFVPFSLFSRPRAGLATVLGSFFRLATNTLNVRNNNLNTIALISTCTLGLLLFLTFSVSVLPGCNFSRLYMDGWRDGLNRLWRDGVTILPRPAKIIATAKNNRPVPALEKKKTPFRPVPSKKKKSHPVPPQKKGPPCPVSEKKKPAPSRHEQQNTPPRGWKLETNTTACLFFSLSCCTFISYCSLVRSIFLFLVFGWWSLSLLSSATYKVTWEGARLR